ncbi:MAG TPA: hypothetical protein VFJ74_05520 [Gemmatimonadaceae bacterium]|nr:hypothetical protein [Gemmatimonadaceae bacterium]
MIPFRLPLALVLLLPAFAAGAQSPRFRYDLRDDTAMPEMYRRARDSALAESDRVNHCPPRADTLWAANPRARLPEPWLRASLSPRCGSNSLPNAVRRRLRDDARSLDFYRGVVESRIAGTEDDRAAALRFLDWSADPRYLPLFLRVARSGAPDTLPSGGYDAAYNATLALAPYLATSREAWQLVVRAAVDRTNPIARQAGMLTLAAANDQRSRRTLRGLPLASVNEYVRTRVLDALAHEPCTPGTIFVLWRGVEGQNYSKCELPPDFR